MKIDLQNKNAINFGELLINSLKYSILYILQVNVDDVAKMPIGFLNFKNIGIS